MKGGQFTKNRGVGCHRELIFRDDNNSNQNNINPFEQYNSAFELYAMIF